MAGLTMGTWWAMVGMSLAAIGFYGSKGPFCAMPPMFLTGTALAARPSPGSTRSAISAASSAPGMSASMKDATGSYSGGLYGLALLGLVSAVVCALFLHIPEPSKTVAAKPAE